MRRLLVAYQVMAYVTGLGLLALVCVAMPMKYFGGEPGPTTVIGQLHGFLFMIYAVLVLLLGYARGWTVRRILLVLVAGTIPFAAFVAERRVVAGERTRSAGVQADPSQREQTGAG